MKVSRAYMCMCLVVISFQIALSQSNLASPGEVLLESKDLKVSLVSNEHDHMFLNADFENDGENLTISTLNVIKSILIYNKKSELEFVIPVGADNVIIGRDMFEQEHYKIEFQFENSIEMVSATLAIK